MDRLEHLSAEARACRACADLPLGPRPVFRLSAAARVLLIGQAPGTRVHETGIPWNDRSGDRLRDWLGLDRDRFYDTDPVTGRVAIVPMGFCYPGVDARGGDKPPRPTCAPLWHDRMLALMPGVRLTLLIGQYAQKHHLAPAQRGPTLTDTVARWRAQLPAGHVALPHPSWRNTAWIRKNPWFDAELLPALRATVAAILAA